MNSDVTIGEGNRIAAGPGRAGRSTSAPRSRARSSCGGCPSRRWRRRAADPAASTTTRRSRSVPGAARRRPDRGGPVESDRACPRTWSRSRCRPGGCAAPLAPRAVSRPQPGGPSPRSSWSRRRRAGPRSTAAGSRAGTTHPARSLAARAADRTPAGPPLLSSRSTAARTRSTAGARCGSGRSWPAAGIGVWAANPRGSQGYGEAFNAANFRDWGPARCATSWPASTA